MGEAFWYLVAFLPLLALLVLSLVEVVRRPDLTGARRVGWIAVLLLVPLLGLVAYVVTRPAKRPSTTEGSGAGTRAELLVAAAERRQRGQLDEAGYRRELVAIGVADDAEPAT